MLSCEERNLTIDWTAITEENSTESLSTDCKAL